MFLDMSVQRKRKKLGELVRPWRDIGNPDELSSKQFVMRVAAHVEQVFGGSESICNHSNYSIPPQMSPTTKPSGKGSEGSIKYVESP